MHRFKVDENLPVEVAIVMREAGHDAVTVLDQKLGGRPDPDIAAVCRSERRAIVTCDLGFGDIRSYPPSEHDGIVVLRLRIQEKPHVLRVVRMLLPALADHALQGALWTVDESSVRIYCPEG